ncbi:SusC/RagA family TonB-linked outer membrane protein [Elizabethkingia anophelis]|uniref:SusC/RagA family TonB-linked outer membrane protein n=1 Tax=Elizabethkingia anophelis TaxID=1117645 RepID=UPI0021A91934|nr:SusC/RagA family TonB-linked outer membrane protein [Elizabethkingia anophelis]MCT3811631.1 SusC/RagA family TonB-linked outer membrane protein [Elizabethkingia anophelis]MCT3819012.1 SusC/RagA family TonB-linked outer membrane protein [Elizabethkingia anophelis]MCT3941098.1 SusC/RagA family TonB-linked outer membrane protein [Elizabethkingia anophelis]MCT4194151.1 SusC/RagA family TonB-linked outer membrane protein [Elizabethkingia anophelis]
MKTQIKNFGKVGVCFFLMSGMIHAQTTKKDSLNEKKIEEVVVLGYKTQRKGNTSESYSLIKKEDLKAVTTPNVANMIQGRAAGVQVIQSSGAPGSGASIIIRGATSISGARNPIWVVDGVIFNGSPNLDPNQIESISVLKDAASTALYGSRGASGVVQVTTKSGKKGTNQLSVTANTTYSVFNTGKFKLMNGQQMYDFWSNEMKYSDVDFTSVLRNRNFDWLNAGTQSGLIQNYTVEFSGGTDKSKTYISGNYYKEEGSVIGNKMDRIAFRLNHEYEVNNKLILKPKVSMTYNTNYNQQHSLYQMYLNMPWDSPYLADGKIGRPRLDYPTSGSDKWWGRDMSNYYYDLQRDYSKGSNFNVSVNGDFDYKILKNLVFSSVNNFTLYYDDSMSYSDPLSIGGSANGGAIYKYTTKRLSRYFNQMLKYNKTFGEHSIDALAAYEFQDSKNESVNASVSHIVGGKEVLDAGASTMQKPTGGGNSYMFQGFLFNTNYSYAGKYLAQFSIRRDGASIYGADVRYGTFWSASAAWNMHKESFLQRDWLTELKLRASYGLVGNQPGSVYYGWQDLYYTTIPGTSLGYTYDGFPGAVLTQVENKKYSWEIVKTTNVGFDFRIFNRLGITADFYIKDNNDMSYRYTYPVLAGQVWQYQNIGKLRNKGFEIAVNYDVVKNQNFKWTLDFNIGLNRNKIISLKDGKPIPNGNKRYIEGEDINAFYMRKWSGVDSKNGDPLWEVVASDGTISTTNNYNAATLQKVGTATPDYFGGINSSLQYKGIFLDINAFFSKGGLIYNGPRELFDSDGAYPTYNQMYIAEQGWTRWQKPGDEATHPKAVYNNTSLSNKTSSRYLEDASFIKIRSIRLGYNIPRQWLEGMKIKNASIYVNAENMFTFTKFSFTDPEVGFGPSGTSPYNEADAAHYPVPRKITLGVNLTF